MPSNENRLSHSVWECKYHIVWIPKYRNKKVFSGLRKYLGEVFHDLARQKECRITEGHMCADHIHILIEIPPKYSVSQVVGFIKGKSAIAIARNFMGRRQNYTGQSFWHGVIMCPRLVEMKQQSGITSSNRKRRIRGWSSWNCSKFNRCHAAFRRRKF